MTVIRELYLIKDRDSFINLVDEFRAEHAELDSYMAYEKDKNWRLNTGFMFSELESRKKSGFPNIVYVAELGEELVGFCRLQKMTSPFSLVYRSHDFCIIEEIFVKDGFRSRNSSGTVGSLGIGRKLVKSAQDWAVKNGCKVISVGFVQNNAQVGEFYRRCGLLPSGVLAKQILADFITWV